CAYCESRLISVSYGDIEHFRPKTALTKDDGTNCLEYPGYYWLAMVWDNLLLSCEKCNRTFKGNQFPLTNYNKRKKNQTHKITEKPLLINPCKEDPSRHLSFENDGTIVARTKKGEKSIEVYGLYRSELTDDRREIIKDILWKISQIKSYINTISDYNQMIESNEFDNSKFIKSRNDNITNMIMAFESIQEYYNIKSKPHRAMVIHITKDFMNLYSDSINNLIKKKQDTEDKRNLTEVQLL
ncbi:hypothetical protein V7056_20240, partial [Bacillus sp. JJ664]